MRIKSCIFFVKMTFSIFFSSPNRIIIQYEHIFNGIVPVSCPQRVLALSLKTHKVNVELYSLALLLRGPEVWSWGVNPVYSSYVCKNCKLNLYLLRKVRRPIPFVIHILNQSHGSVSSIWWWVFFRWFPIWLCGKSGSKCSSFGHNSSTLKNSLKWLLRLLLAF